MTTIANPVKRFGYFIIPFLLLATSCKVHFITDYNADIAKQIDATTRMIDVMYLKMRETTKPGERPYAKFAEGYVDVEVELNSLLNKNKGRTLNNNSIKICEDAVKLWVTLKDEHKKKNDLTDNFIDLNRSQIDDFMLAMLLAEEAKKISTEQKNR